MNKWSYNENRTAYADGTGTYAIGWYAVSPSGYECGFPPNEGPFSNEAEAESAAKRMADEEAITN